MHSLNTILSESLVFYKSLKKDKDKANASRHPASDRSSVIAAFEEASIESLISQKDLCTILKRCSWYIQRLRREMDCAPCRQEGRYLFYKKSKVLEILQHVNNKKTERNKS